jgi:hypothetical protein
MECGAAYEYAAEIMAKNTLEPDAQEGINAFVDKRGSAAGSRETF